MSGADLLGALGPGTAEAPAPRKPVLVVPRARGRNGVSTLADWMIQRGRHAGRRVKPLDGDHHRSGTLTRLYPAGDGEGAEDAAAFPPGEDAYDVKGWMLREFDAMAEDGVSRVLDLGGGEKIVRELVRELALPEFCEGIGAELVPVFVLGPEREDLRHVVQIIRSGDLKGAAPVLVLNEGVVRHGQSTAGVFGPVFADPDFRALLADRARYVTMDRLVCMDALRDAGLGFYGAAYPAKGVKVSATMRAMTAKWLRDNEARHVEAGTAGRLP